MEVEKQWVWQLLRLQKPQTKWECWSETPWRGWPFPRRDTGAQFWFCSTTWNFWEVTGLTSSNWWEALPDIQICWYESLSIPFSNESQSLGSLFHRWLVIPLVRWTGSTTRTQKCPWPIKQVKKWTLYFRWQFNFPSKLAMGSGLRVPESHEGPPKLHPASHLVLIL